MRLEVVIRAIDTNKVVRRAWVIRVIAAGVELTPDERAALWGGRVSSAYGAAVPYARILGVLREKKSGQHVQLFNDRVNGTNMWCEYIEHPHHKPLELPTPTTTSVPQTMIVDDTHVDVVSAIYQRQWLTEPMRTIMQRLHDTDVAGDVVSLF